jgi:hypothetical protein
LLPHVTCDVGDAFQSRIAWFSLAFLKAWIGKQEQVQNRGTTDIN